MYTFIKIKEVNLGIRSQNQGKLLKIISEKIKKELIINENIDHCPGVKNRIILK